MATKLDQIEDLVHDFQYVEDDRIVTTVGLVATFYFWGGHTKKKRQALVHCIEAFEERYGNELKWGCDPESWKTRSLNDKKLPNLHDYVASLDEDDCIEWHLSSSNHREEVADFSITCMTERGWQDDQISWLRFQLPRRHAFESDLLKEFESLLSTCIEKLEPLHGNAGLAAVTPLLEVPYEGDVFDVATRYRTLYIEGAADLLCAAHGPKSVNWINIIGDNLAERLGGPQAYANYSHNLGIDATRLGKTVVIRTGATPEISPLSEPLPEGYVRANAAIRPLRDGAYDSMGGGSIHGEMRFNRYTSDLWIRRLDVPNTWPPLSFAGLGGEPMGQPPLKIARLKTGERCKIYGRYKRTEAETAELVLLPEDIAPFHVLFRAHGQFVSREATAWELVATL